MKQRLIEGDTVVISLIPYTYHATVIKSAIRKKKNVVTSVSSDWMFQNMADGRLRTSYVSPAMLELEKGKYSFVLSSKLFVRNHG